MNALVRAGFALLVAATFAAFFVAQKLKHEPTVVLALKSHGFDARFFHPTSFSPNGDDYKGRVAIGFALRRGDDVTASIASVATGDVVRHLADVGAEPRYRGIIRHWDGRTDDGARAPDGAYRVLVGLRREGRTVTLPGRISLDTTAPRIRVTSVSHSIVPDHGERAIRVRFRGSARFPPTLLVIRTDLARPQVVAEVAGRRNAHALDWDGAVAGAPAPAGTYLMGVESRDSAENFGHFPSTLPPTKVEVGFHPRLPAPSARPAPAGVTVRAIAAAPTVLTPVLAGHRVTFFVDSRREPYTWKVRRLGFPAARSHGRSTHVQLTVRAPAGISDVYLLDLRTAAGATTLPFAVQSAHPAHHPVLLVLPYLSWQGRNALDSDGDGLPDTLARGASVPLLRPLGLPVGFTGDEAPLIQWLDRTGLRYDITTDAALALGQGPRLAGHSGVLFAGQPGWSTAALAASLRHYVSGGGRVLSIGVDELRRSVRLKALTLAHAGSEGTQDVLGLGYGPLTKLSGPLTVFTPSDLSGLFSASTGTFSGLPAYEPLADAGSGRVLSYAGPAPGRRAIAAVKIGLGLALRIGVPDWTPLLGRDAAVTTLMRQAWTVLSR